MGYLHRLLGFLGMCTPYDVFSYVFPPLLCPLSPLLLLPPHHLVLAFLSRAGPFIGLYLASRKRRNNSLLGRSLARRSGWTHQSAIAWLLVRVPMEQEHSRFGVCFPRRPDGIALVGLLTYPCSSFWIRPGSERRRRRGTLTPGTCQVMGRDDVMNELLSINSRRESKKKKKLTT